MLVSAPRIELSLVLFLFTAASGLWLTHTGRPLNVAIFTAHKLIALATVVFLVITVVQLVKAVETRDLLTVGLIAAAGLSFVALFVSGALLNLEKPAAAAVLRIHQVAPFLAVISAASAIYLLFKGRVG